MSEIQPAAPQLVVVSYITKEIYEPDSQGQLFFYQAPQRPARPQTRIAVEVGRGAAAGTSEGGVLTGAASLDSQDSRNNNIGQERCQTQTG